MTFSRLLVQLTALVFATYGLAFAIAPAFMAEFSTAAVPQSASALIDTRATYGGMSVAVGLILFLLASQANTIRVGLQAVLLLMLGMAVGRMLGMALDGAANTLMFVYLALELVAVALAGVLLSREGAG